MVKHVFGRFIPAALVFVSWSAFVAGVLVTDPVSKIALLSLAKACPKIADFTVGEPGGVRAPVPVE
jgi:hypothetical protein